MQKRVAPAAFACRATDRFKRQQFLGLDAGSIARGLRAIRAVFGTAAGLDREQGGDLHGIGVVAGPMNPAWTCIGSAKGRPSRTSTSSRDQSWRTADIRVFRITARKVRRVWVRHRRRLNLGTERGSYVMMTRSLVRVMATRCLLCGADATHANGLCMACHDYMPRNDCCCQRCALPLEFPAEQCGACLQREPPFEQVQRMRIAEWCPGPRERRLPLQASTALLGRELQRQGAALATAIIAGHIIMTGHAKAIGMGRIGPTQQAAGRHDCFQQSRHHDVNFSLPCQVDSLRCRTQTRRTLAKSGIP